MQKRSAKVVGIVSAVIAMGAACFWRRAMRHEAERLTTILGWQDGAAVADVGAGNGRLALEAARRVGASGRVFATDINRKKLQKIGKKSLKDGLGNITILEADGEQSGLPSDCCESILLRGSYHHVARPSAMTANLYRALRPGGVLAIVEFPPRWWLSLVAPVKEVPANRGGHGIPRDVLIQEFTTVGFELQETIPGWFLDTYCVVFRKPSTEQSNLLPHSATSS